LNTGIGYLEKSWTLPILGDIQNPIGHGPENLLQFTLLRGGVGLDKSSEIFSTIIHAVIFICHLNTFSAARLKKVPKFKLSYRTKKMQFTTQFYSRYFFFGTSCILLHTSEVFWNSNTSCPSQ